MQQYIIVMSDENIKVHILAKILRLISLSFSDCLTRLKKPNILLTHSQRNRNGTRYISSETKSFLCVVTSCLFKKNDFYLRFLSNHYTDCQFQYYKLKLDISFKLPNFYTRECRRCPLNVNHYKSNRQEISALLRSQCVQISAYIQFQFQSLPL